MIYIYIYISLKSAFAFVLTGDNVRGGGGDI